MLTVRPLQHAVIFFGYSYRWLRGQDYSLAPDWLLQHCVSSAMVCFESRSARLVV